MYGFGGVGQVEVRFGEMSPWRDEQPNEQPNKERQSYSANGLWKAEMSNIQDLQKIIAYKSLQYKSL